MGDKDLKNISTTGRESPSIGRIVHYVNPETGKHEPAIIANIEDGYIDLYRIDANLSVNRIDDPKAALGTWHWPEHVPPTEE
jgi:hypothetical protein